MTALERALVVYAEARGYEIEVHIEYPLWNVKETPGFFNFATCDYRIKNREDFRKVHDELSDFFKPLYTPEKKRTWNIEDLKKHKPAGFSCKSGLEEVSELLEKNNVKIGINSDPNIIPNYDNFINDFVEEDLDRPKEEEFDVKKYVKSLVQTPEYLERCKEVDPIIEILEAYKNGETIERKEKYSSYEWSECETMELFNPMDFWYRIAPKQPEPIPATDEELKEIKAEKNSCFWVKDKTSGIIWKFPQMGVDVLESFYILNLSTKCWEDWSSK